MFLTAVLYRVLLRVYCQRQSSREQLLKFLRSNLSILRGSKLRLNGAALLQAYRAEARILTLESDSGQDGLISSFSYVRNGMDHFCFWNLFLDPMRSECSQPWLHCRVIRRRFKAKQSRSKTTGPPKRCLYNLHAHSGSLRFYVLDLGSEPSASQKMAQPSCSG